MKILMVHSRYQQLGGEDISTRNEARLLRDAGHEVDLVEYDNHQIEQMGAARAGLRAIWSRTARRDLAAKLDGGGFDILHVQNYLPMVSPAVLRLGKRYGVATVQALRNYRLICTKAQFFRDGKDCHDCLGKALPWAGIRHRCYRDSLPATLALTGMIATHRAIGTWSRETDAFIAVSDYVRSKYIEGGFDPAKLHAKPNVVAAAGPASVTVTRQLVYVGRLSAEKGVDVLLEAWRRAGVEGELVLGGSGPALESLQQQASDIPGVRFLGRIPSEQARALMRGARAMVIPSVWAEPFPRTGVEAMAEGTPVIGASSGGIPELFPDGRGGVLYPASLVDALAGEIRDLFAGDDKAARWRIDARAVFDEHFSPAAVTRRTEEIYAAAIDRRRARTG